MQIAKAMMGSVGPITAELDSDSTIRLLLADTDPDHTDRSVTLARELLTLAKQSARPRAELHACLLLTCALQDAGRRRHRTCTRHRHVRRTRLIRPLLDGGLNIGEVLAICENSVHARPLPPGWSDEAAAYLVGLPLPPR